MWPSDTQEPLPDAGTAGGVTGEIREYPASPKRGRRQRRLVQHPSEQGLEPALRARHAVNLERALNLEAARRCPATTLSSISC